MIKIIKNTGLGMVLIAFSILIGTLFLNQFKLTNKVIENAGMSEIQLIYFSNSSQNIIDQNYGSKIGFIKALKQTFNSANKNITTDFSITESDIDKLVELSNTDGQIKYSTDFAKLLFNKDIGSDVYKIKGIKDYTSWIEDREIATIEEIKDNLSNSIDGFNNSILYTNAFDDYTITTLTLSMAMASSTGFLPDNKNLFFFLTFILGIIGALIFIIPKFFDSSPGIKHNNIFKNPLNNRGWIGVILGSFLIIFYILLYFFPVYILEWILISDVASEAFFGREASQWFLYGFLYTIAVLVMGLRFLTKYRHNKYQQIRTYSVMFFQLGFAFIIPQILFSLNLPEVDLKNIWPLDYSFFYDWRVDGYVQSGALGLTMFAFGLVLMFIGVPVLTYFYGKRWYCSWVCGCGGLAETAGDPFRQLSSKKLSAWKIERYLIYSVLVFAVLMTIWVVYTTITAKNMLLGINSYEVRKVYGFLISSIFAGVVGTGFYPLMGNRVWCRFGCPLAGYLGIVQKFKSRFRITTNGGQCISCGNCSTYCEMGIDVRWYAQRGQNIIRSSCVGCGVCAAVCPRGVLKLENKNEKGRYNEPVLLGNDGVINIRKSRIKEKIVE
ncbi:MAG: 4Fe-4S binding protein [Bacteroidales bacterium]|nr:4Fe-4S binding protein [Bacteroidales bacterium]